MAERHLPGDVGFPLPLIMKLLAIIGVCLCLNFTGYPSSSFAATNADSRLKHATITFLQAKDTDIVYFNTNSSKYHIASCRACKACTHCIELTRKEAKQRGGVPCKLCGANE